MNTLSVLDKLFSNNSLYNKFEKHELEKAQKELGIKIPYEKVVVTIPFVDQEGEIITYFEEGEEGETFTPEEELVYYKVKIKEYNISGYFGSLPRGSTRNTKETLAFANGVVIERTRYGRAENPRQKVEVLCVKPAEAG